MLNYREKDNNLRSEEFNLPQRAKSQSRNFQGVKEQIGFHQKRKKAIIDENQSNSSERKYWQTSEYDKLPLKVRNAIDIAENKKQHSAFYYKLEDLNQKINAFRSQSQQKLPSFEKKFHQKKQKELEDKVKSIEAAKKKKKSQSYFRTNNFYSPSRKQSLYTFQNSSKSIKETSTLTGEPISTFQMIKNMRKKSQNIRNDSKYIKIQPNGKRVSSISLQGDLNLQNPPNSKESSLEKSQKSDQQNQNSKFFLKPLKQIQTLTKHKCNPEEIVEADSDQENYSPQPKFKFKFQNSQLNYKRSSPLPKEHCSSENSISLSDANEQILEIDLINQQDQQVTDYSYHKILTPQSDRIGSDNTFPDICQSKGQTALNTTKNAEKYKNNLDVDLEDDFPSFIQQSTKSTRPQRRMKNYIEENKSFTPFNLGLQKIPVKFISKTEQTQLTRSEMSIEDVQNKMFDNNSYFSQTARLNIDMIKTTKNGVYKQNSFNLSQLPLTCNSPKINDNKFINIRKIDHDSNRQLSILEKIAILKKEDASKLPPMRSPSRPKRQAKSCLRQQTRHQKIISLEDYLKSQNKQMFELYKNANAEMQMIYKLQYQPKKNPSPNFGKSRKSSFRDQNSRNSPKKIKLSRRQTFNDYNSVLRFSTIDYY